MKSVIFLSLLLILTLSKCTHKKKATFKARNRSRHTLRKKFINHKAKGAMVKASLFRRIVTNKKVSRT